ncbi:polysaccharide pyruvyl transferase family protein [Microbacterium sp. P02]|uniref:polysaccharide pyruvyl transferase family protein n=1 Tax=Microbacterium sp. P02 TaxID=3366260 RepID=UPI0036704CD9
MNTSARTSSRPLAIAHIGAFSMPNWGDKLYPGALASLLDILGVPAQLSHYCPVPGSTSAGEAILPLDKVRDSDADVALVGGGDLLRFDNRTVAMDHLSVPSADRGKRINRLRARWFGARHFLNGPGAWAPAEPWISTGPSVLISAGVHTVPADSAAQKAVANYRAAWVRTHNGADRLAGAGVARDRIVVAPDMIFAMPDFEIADRVRDRGEAIFHQHAGLSDAPLVFHAAQFHGWPLDRVKKVLSGLKGIPMVTLSLGSYAGEDRLLSAAAAEFAIPTLHDLPADDITAVLAGAGAVFTTSMHAAIVAASFGTPVLVPGVGKTRDAFAVLPEPPTLREVEDDTLRAAVEELLGRRLPHSRSANRDAVIAAFEATLHAADVI